MLLSSSAVTTAALLLVLQSESELVARACQQPPSHDPPVAAPRRVGLIPTIEISLDYAPNRIGEVHGDLDLLPPISSSSGVHHHRLTGLQVWSVSLRWQSRAANKVAPRQATPKGVRRRSLCDRYQQLSVERPQTLQDTVDHWRALAQLEALLIGEERHGEVQ